MRRYRNCRHGIRFADERMNINPTIQIIQRLERLFEELKSIKKDLIRTNGVGEEPYALMNELYAIQGNILAETKRLQNEVGKNI